MFVTSLTAACLCLVVVQPTTAQNKEDAMFAYTQVMSNCVGQQFIDQQTERLVTAVRRCEQAAPQPLRDRALEAVISNLQGSTGRVVYVPVAVGAGAGGGVFGAGAGGGVFGGAGRFPLNQFTGGAFNPNFNSPGFNAPGNLNQGFPAFTGFNQQPGFNQQTGFNRLDNTQNQLGNSIDLRRPDSSFGASFGQVTNNNGNSRTNNPFGFNFGKQTTDEATVQLPVAAHTEKSLSSPPESVAHQRSRRQVSNDAKTRLEALNYLSNMTCVMREAGMIDHNNLPNYQFFENELRRIQVSRDLRNDLTNGMFFCKDLTQCMSVDRLSHPLARELGQAVAYLRCIARTNVKACKKQDKRRNQGNSRLTGAFSFFSGNGMDLLNSVSELALADDSLGFDFF